MATGKKPTLKTVPQKAVAVKSPSFLEERPGWSDPDSNRGSQEVTTNDITLPRLQIVQSLSPQRIKNNAAYIPGAEEGMCFNTVTLKLYDGNEGLYFVPVYYHMEYVAWVKRDEGGGDGTGFRGAFDTMAEAQAAVKEMDDSDSIEILDTAQQYGLIVDRETGDCEEIVCSMTKTGLKASRSLNTLVQMTGGDRFSRVYRLSTEFIEGPKGSYYRWRVEASGFVPEDIFHRGERMYENILGGRRSIDRSATPAAEDDGSL